MGERTFKGIMIGCITLCAAALVSLSALTLGWFSGPAVQTDSQPPIDGDIGLRGYFFAGNGSNRKPFEITNPNHFYNLTRLQNLGIFAGTNTSEDSDDGKWHFQIGHDFGDGPRCIEYDAAGNEQPKTYLNMQGTVVSPIGGEGSPFMGVFNGNGIPIKNLVVEGYPEDMGVFGYVSHEGVVKGLVCDNIEIRSTGYTSDTEDDRYNLFYPNVDELFVQNATGFKTASLSLLKKGVSGETNLKKLNGASGTEILELNKDENIDTGTISKYYFKANYPTGRNKGPFSYSWKSSSPIIAPRSLGSNEMLVDLSALRDSEDFNIGSSKQIDARISLIASISVDGFVFSRVIQSYSVQFYSHGHGYTGWIVKEKKIVKVGTGEPSDGLGQDGDYYIDSSNATSANAALYFRNNNTWSPVEGVTNGTKTLPSRTAGNAGDYYINIKGDNAFELYMKESTDGYYTASIFCDYAVQENPNDKNTHYHHGNNIGFLAGHVDGTIENSYVYNGKFVFNNAGNSYVPIATETDLGLVGEIGTHVVNTIEPEIGLTTHGDTGIINLSKIYSLIRDKDASDNDVPMRYGDAAIKAGQTNDKNYISYSNYLSPTATRFSSYLRTGVDNPKEYITGVSSDMSGGSPARWHNYSLPQNIPNDFNSVDFLWNRVIEDEPNSQHVDTTNNQLYIKERFEWGDPLTNGVIVESLTPSSGIDNSYYFNLVTNTLFRKIASGWEKIDALHGKVSPTESFGHSGDLYVDTVNGELHLRDEYSWSKTADVIIVSVSPDNNTGSNGNYFIDTLSYSVFVKETGEWNLMENTTHSAGIPDKSPNNSGDRGLGVFKIVSSYNEQAKIAAENDPYSYFVSNIGDCRILKGTPKTKVYFSTAEYDHSKGSKNSSWGSNGPMRATTIPTYFDSKSFEWPFSRDYNYCFELDLTQMNQATGQYMFNTHSEFLAHYLYGKLIDKFKTAIKPGDDRFGFMFRSSENERLDSLSSYIPLKKPGTKSNFGTDANPRYYPSNSIVFSIDNDNGANVSVVGNNADITIYSNNKGSSDAVEPVYTMRAAPAPSTDEHRFFSYDFKSGVTGNETVKYGDLYLNTTNNKLYRKESSGSWTELTTSTGNNAPTGVGSSDGAYYVQTTSKTVYKFNATTVKWEKVYGVITGTTSPSVNPSGSNMGDAGALYGHIFKLKKGDYVIGAANSGETANIYFLAVQGQTDATIGANDIAGIGNAVTEVDFLTASPEYGEQFSFAQFSFKSTFNTVNGEFTIGIDENDNDRKFRIVFSDTAHGVFVTYLLMYSRSKTLQYWVLVDTHSNKYTDESTTYPRS